MLCLRNLLLKLTEIQASNMNIKSEDGEHGVDIDWMAGDLGFDSLHCGTQTGHRPSEGSYHRGGVVQA